MSAALPLEIQKLIPPHLDCQSLLNLRAADRRHRDAITRDCRDVWRARHDARWPNGKRRRRDDDDPRRRRAHDVRDVEAGVEGGIEAWSRAGGWEVHPAREADDDDDDDDGGDWCREFLRRCRLDRSVSPRLAELNVGQSRSNEVWCGLMADGEDIVDRLKSILLLEQRNAPDASDSTALVAAAEKALNGIGRCAAYQEWKFLHHPSVIPRTNVEDGAIAIAKFYDRHDAMLRAERIHSWEADVLDELERLADVVKGRLDDRLGVDSENYPVLEVVEAMSCLFRAPGQLDDDPAVPRFIGNVGDYYNHTNSLINNCLVTRNGIPITLAVIYAAIVRRVCGVQMDIIGLPGHIVVGVPNDGGRDRAFVDPFREGRVLTLADCRAVVERYNMTFRDDMVRPIPNGEVWQRMVRNLIHSHSMQALAEDNDGGDDGSESSSTHEWKIAIPLRFLLSDYAPRIGNFRELAAAPGWCPQFC